MVKTDHAENTNWHSGIFIAVSNQGLKHADGLCVHVFLCLWKMCVLLKKKGSARHKFPREPHLVAWLSGRAVFCQMLPLDTGAKEHYQESI